MKDFHFDAISAFENYEIEKMRDGLPTPDDNRQL
ncbi:thioesterase [Streptococcus pneumoniae]|nr:thioesterase [Streptococcus pneumoniae]